MLNLSKIFHYGNICSSNDNLRRDELIEYAKTMGILLPETMTKEQLCTALDVIATDTVRKRPYCTNLTSNDDGLNGRNMMGDRLEDIPPYLIYGVWVINRINQFI